MAALCHVIDPELGLDVVALGMVGDVEIDGGSVLISLRLTTMSCPFWNLFVDQIEGAVGEVEGVEEVEVRFDRRRPWSPERMSEDARRELEAGGLLPPSIERPLGLLKAEVGR
jgi:metal-sulfur cluster biosynthetic enzyme